MQSQANQLLAFTNYSVVIDYLLVNYRRVLSNANQVGSLTISSRLLQTASVAMLVLPYKDLSTGVITVMILTCCLSVGWAVCLTYIVVLGVKRRRNRR